MTAVATQARSRRGRPGDRRRADPAEAPPTLFPDMGGQAASAPSWDMGGQVAPTPSSDVGGAAAPTWCSAVGGEPTLEALISGVWEGLAAHGRADCPVCGAEMIARAGAHARPSEGRCGGCGATLSR